MKETNWWWLVGAGFVLANLAAAVLVTPLGTDDDPDEVADGATAEQSADTDTDTEESADYLVDPQFFEAQDMSWAVGSSLGDGPVLPMFERVADDTWNYAGAALSETPAWAAADNFAPYSPSILQDGDTWWLFFAGPHADTGEYCVGAATSTTPADGFEPIADPVHCAEGHHLLDPSPYRDEDRPTLVWTDLAIPDDSADGEALWEIHAADLDLGNATVAESTTLLTSDGAEDAEWEAGTIGAPALLDVDGTLVLLYGGNEWGSTEYASGYAVCESTREPCERRTVDEPLDIPIPDDSVEVTAIGGSQPVVTADRTGIGLHGWHIDEATGEPSEPVTYVTTLSWQDGELRIDQARRVEVNEE